MSIANDTKKRFSAAGSIPTLAAWLETNGRKDSGAGLDDFIECTLRTLAMVEPSEPNLGCMLRMLQTIMIAIVEMGNIEAMRGIEPAVYLPTTARAMGWSLMAALCSAQHDDAPPPRSMARLFTEEFRAGALAMLDQFGDGPKGATP